MVTVREAARQAGDTGPAVSVRGLTKSYADVPAVRGIDLEIGRGEIFALLGPNGAGKTTTVEILEGYRHRDDGQVTVLGHDPGRERAALKPRIGIVLQSTGVDRYLTVAETLAMYAGYLPPPQVAGRGHRRSSASGRSATRGCTTLSGGQQRRLDVGVALVGDPELLFLDEPTTGFDPSARREAWQVVKNLAELGKTVLLTTHYMDEAQFLADRVAVIAAGRIVAEGRPSSLGGRDRAQLRVRFRLAPGTPLPRGEPAASARTGAWSWSPSDLTATLHRLDGLGRRAGHRTGRAQHPAAHARRRLPRAHRRAPGLQAPGLRPGRRSQPGARRRAGGGRKGNAR